MIAVFPPFHEQAMPKTLNIRFNAKPGAVPVSSRGGLNRSVY
jgi:hypothetical protein